GWRRVERRRVRVAGRDASNVQSRSELARERALLDKILVDFHRASVLKFDRVNNSPRKSSEKFPASLGPQAYANHRRECAGTVRGFLFDLDSIVVGKAHHRNPRSICRQMPLSRGLRW